MSGLYLTKDQLDFICYVAGRIDSSSKLNGKMDKCLNGISIAKKSKFSSNETIDNIRKNHFPTLTADFFSQFQAPDGLKFLTHDFDPDSGNTIENVVNQARTILCSPKYFKKLPDSLYPLINGFICGDKWYDYNGEFHNNNLSNGKLKAWIDSNPTLHPISSPDYGGEIQAFRNTVRVSKPILPKLITNFIDRNPGLQNLDIQLEKLDRADFYTNVNRLINCIIGKVLFDMAQRDSTAEIKIAYDRSAWNEYRLHKIKVIHVGSEANMFEDVREKCMCGGGALFELAKSCQGYCDWAIEANFEGEYKRWRILSAQNLPEVESLDKNDIIGFSHIFTFYKK